MRCRKHSSNRALFQPFEDLRKIIETKKLRISPSPIPVKKEERQSDDELFAAAMEHVREIREFRKMPVRQKNTSFTPEKKLSSDEEALRAIREIISGRRPLNLADTQEYVEWTKPGCKANIAKALHKGRYSVQDCLDLHGLVTEEAEDAVERFLKEARKNQYRCVKIIHGRGLRSPVGPVLKDALIKWLSGRFGKYLIAFVTARACDGGLGAVYVLLR